MTMLDRTQDGYKTNATVNLSMIQCVCRSLHNSVVKYVHQTAVAA